MLLVWLERPLHEPHVMMLGGREEEYGAKT